MTSFNHMCWSDHGDMTNVTSVEFERVIERRSEEIFYEKANYWCSNLLLPLIFLFGIVGNVLNIVIFRYAFFHEICLLTMLSMQTECSACQ